MNFDFSDDQRLLQDEVRKMLASTCTSAEVRKSLAGEAPYSDGVWRELLLMGAATAAIPEQYGGAGLGYLELCLVAEEAGRHLAPVPLATNVYLAAEAIIQSGNVVQMQAWLPRIAAGEIVGTASLCTSESYLVHSPTFDGHCLTGKYVLPDGMVACMHEFSAAVAGQTRRRSAGDAELMFDERVKVCSA